MYEAFIMIVVLSAMVYGMNSTDNDKAQFIIFFFAMGTLAALLVA
jgi:hypothetical protein